MSDNLDPQDVAKRLLDTARLLSAAGTELTHLDEEFVRAKQRHEVAYARAFLEADGRNIEERKARAILATENQRVDMDIAEVKLRACKERLRTLHAQADIARSLNAGMRATASLAGAA